MIAKSETAPKLEELAAPVQSVLQTDIVQLTYGLRTAYEGDPTRPCPRPLAPGEGSIYAHVCAHIFTHVVLR